MAETLERIRPHLYVASRQGILALLCNGGEADAQPFALHGLFVRCLLADGKGVLVAAGIRDRGVQATADGGRTWREAKGISGRDVRVLEASGRRIYAGTAPTGLFVSEDGGSSFRGLPALDGPWRESWAAPGTENVPRVSGIVARGKRILVSVNHGGVLRSDDGGERFRDATGDLPRSVLGLSVPPSDGEGVRACTALGIFASARPGEEPWRHRYTPAERMAVTAVAFHPTRPVVRICGAARVIGLAKPAVPEGADAWIYRSDDGGERWSEVKRGLLPVLRGVITSIVFVPSSPDRVFVGTSAGEIFESGDAGLSFRMAASTLPGVLGLVPGPASI
jgi:photosystem II stability/assembly factor-like uncharacterized protein